MQKLEQTPLTYRGLDGTITLVQKSKLLRWYRPGRRKADNIAQSRAYTVLVPLTGGSSICSE
jgi:hypothetical protein